MGIVLALIFVLCLGSCVAIVAKDAISHFQPHATQNTEAVTE